MKLLSSGSYEDTKSLYFKKYTSRCHVFATVCKYIYNISQESSRVKSKVTAEIA